MENERLKQIALGVVDNQLSMDDPPCTKQTLVRLVASGHTKKEAKEMIAAMVLEDIYFILKDNRPFDEKKYAEKLDSLR